MNAKQCVAPNKNMNRYDHAPYDNEYHTVYSEQIDQGILESSMQIAAVNRTRIAKFMIPITLFEMSRSL